MPYDPNWRWSPTAISLDEPNSVHSFDRWALNGWHYFFQVHPGIGKWCEIGLLGWWAGNGRTEDTVLENYVALWLTCFGGVHWWKKLVFHSQATQECIFGKICTDAGFSLDVWVHMWGCRDEKIGIPFAGYPRVYVWQSMHWCRIFLGCLNTLFYLDSLMFLYGRI